MATLDSAQGHTFPVAGRQWRLASVLGGRVKDKCYMSKMSNYKLLDSLLKCLFMFPTLTWTIGVQFEGVSLIWRHTCMFVKSFCCHPLGWYSSNMFGSHEFFVETAGLKGPRALCKERERERAKMHTKSKAGLQKVFFFGIPSRPLFFSHWTWKKHARYSKDIWCNGRHFLSLAWK